jgi:hypothetical protein
MDILAAIYRFIGHWSEGASGGVGRGAVVWNTVKELGTILKESSFLTAKTSAMVCWPFVGSGIFSAAFALLGGQEVIEKWVLSLDMTPVQFMILAQFIIFILGWPLEWTEIVIIFMPIFLPLLPHFNIDPLFFGLLVALNLQTAFLSPPAAMAAFYLKGVSPPHVTLNAIFVGMMPFMGIQVIALALLYAFPGIGLWLPHILYKQWRKRGSSDPARFLCAAMSRRRRRLRRGQIEGARHARLPGSAAGSTLNGLPPCGGDDRGPPCWSAKSCVSRARARRCTRPRPMRRCSRRSRSWRNSTSGHWW